MLEPKSRSPEKEIDPEDIAHKEEMLDEALEESFPASDPPSPARREGEDDA